MKLEARLSRGYTKECLRPQNKFHPLLWAQTPRVKADQDGVPRASGHLCSKNGPNQELRLRAT